MCSNHFEDTMYYPSNNGGKCLLQLTIPTIFNKLPFDEINSNKVQRLLLTLRVINSRLRKEVEHLKSKNSTKL